MTHYPLQFARLGVLTAWLVGAFVAHAQSGALRDSAVFFSEPAKAEASRQITEIGRRFRKDLVVETFREIPEAVRQGVNLQDKPAVNRLFEQWTVQQAKQLRVNGIYILLTKEPAHLQIVVGNETQNNAFTLKDRDALASLMLGHLRNQKPDAALLDGVNFVAATMASHAAARSRPNSTAVVSPSAAGKQSESSGWLGTALAVMLGLAVIWLVVGVIRSLSGGGGNSVGAGAGPASSGGGFFSSLLGGMFGAAAGMWLYDQFSGNHGSAWGSESNPSSSEGGFSGRDSDYSSSGSDFSNNSGSGDSGGGDSGGGDF
ncbi:MAG: hypothetical protein RL514_1094 [Verrucomicrobiota bacterium]|jgi:uncharacterized protein